MVAYADVGLHHINNDAHTHTHRYKVVVMHGVLIMSLLCIAITLAKMNRF